ncbi:hypothetical protein [Streptomyces sp. NPDC051993]|uniref:hypothetical protein n=1 Tax=Streptomyces sp. NPDC051993 TaxID=3155286 RepID=UPI00342C7005
MVNDVCPTLHWHGSGIDIDFRRGWRSNDPTERPEITGRASADMALLVPSAFSSTSMYCIGANDALDKQPFTIICPLLPAAAPGPALGELIGESRSRILADLATPHTTAELAERLHLSRATVSYPCRSCTGPVCSNGPDGPGRSTTSAPTSTKAHPPLRDGPQQARADQPFRTQDIMLRPRQVEAHDAVVRGAWC